MPGCTAPNCTNSSQKGYKLYHFPSDKERNSIWVQNCGRERGWKPTKHTCVCEVHFDESQFESHRADGLRKLKPNAVPTIFNRVTPIRSYTRKPKKESSSDNVCPVTKEKEGLYKADADSELIVDSDLKESEPKGGEKESSDEPLQGESEMLKDPDHTYQKFTLEEHKEQNNKDVTLAVEEVFMNVSVPSQYFTSSVRGRKQGRPVRRYGKKEDVGESSPETSVIKQGRKRGRPPGSTKKLQASLASPVRKSVRVSARKRERLTDIAKEMVQEDYPSSEHKAGEFSGTENSECFVCGKNVDSGVSLHTLTNTTKVYMHDKLDKIVRGEVELLIEEEGILCTRCANLLNYMDRIEVELNMLTKAILNCIRKKYGMGVKIYDKGCETLLPNMSEDKECTGEGDLMNLDLQLRSTDRISGQWRENEDDAAVSSGDMRSDSPGTIAPNEKHESSPSEEMQCHVCRFKTCYKSLMIFHLRQHLKETYWCDFCNVSLPEGVVGQMEKAGDESHSVTSVDIDDVGHAIEDMQDEVEQQETEINDNGVKEVSEADAGMLANSMDLMIAVLPVGAEVTPQDTDVQPDKSENGGSTEETLQLPDESDENSSSLHPAQSISESVKCIRVLSEIEMIVTQEIGSDGEGKNSRTAVSQKLMNSQFPSQTSDCSMVDLTVESQALGDECKDQPILSRCLIGGEGNEVSALKELELNMQQIRSRQFRVLNEMGMIEVASVESTEQLVLDNLSCDMNEMRVNVTPGMMTYSNSDRRLNVSLGDNSS